MAWPLSNSQEIQIDFYLSHPLRPFSGCALVCTVRLYQTGSGSDSGLELDVVGFWAGGYGQGTPMTPAGGGGQTVDVNSE